MNQDGKTHIFPFVDADPFGPERDYKSYIKDCAESNDCKRDSRGIKGKNILSKLKYFKNPPASTNIDYMHTVLEGVIKRFFKFWFEDKVNKNLDDDHNYSLKPFINEIDKRMLNIKIPSFIPVCPRSVLEYHKWRANEFLAFVIFYLLPVFNGFMPAIFYANITKLVVALEYLLNREQRVSVLDHIKQILKLFVQEAETLYPETIMVSGMHELVHLPDCSKFFGPLNLLNCFPFEEVNRKIVNLIFGKDLIGDEFLYNFSILQALTNFCNNFTNNTKLSEFIEKHKLIKTSNKKKIHKNEVIFGTLLDLKIEQINNLMTICSNYDLSGVKVCQRLLYNGVLYTSDSNCSKRGDFSILAEGCYGLIQYFLVNPYSVSVVVRKVSKLSSSFFIKEFPTIRSKLSLCFLTDEYFLTKIEKLQKVMYIKIADDLSFISSFSFSHLFL